MYTGDVRGAGTNANVFLVMYGENGKSDQFDLRNKSDNFERAQVDKFKVSYYGGGKREFAWKYTSQCEGLELNLLQSVKSFVMAPEVSF